MATWQQRVLRKAHARAREVRTKGDRYVSKARIDLQVGFWYARHLAMAAERRGMSRAAYARRAVAAFIAADLGVSFKELLRDVAPVKNPHVNNSFDDGEGYGPWDASGIGTAPES